MAVFNPHNKNMLVMIIVVIVSIVIGVFGISLFSHSSKDTYEPIAAEDKGFIGKANALFLELLRFEATIPTRERDTLNAVEQLNRQYPAFKFALPDEVAQGECVVGDIRLVGLNEKYLDSIKNKNLKTWHYSSELPKIIGNQQKNKFKKFFDLKIGTTDGVAHVAHIKMIPSLYKIKFNSKPWMGTIHGQSYGKIDTTNSLFIVYGSSVLPIHRQNRIFPSSRNVPYIIGLQNNRLQNNNIPIDIYSYYSNHYDQEQSIRFAIDRNSYITLQIWKDSVNRIDSLVFDLPTDLDIYCNTQKLAGTTEAHNSRKGYAFPFSENVLRIIVSDAGVNNKKEEFYLFRQNPMNILSYSIETNKGKLRKQVDTLYTDNFTQQIIEIFNQKMDEKSPTDINLSIDPYLSKTLENELERYVKRTLIGRARTLRRGEKVEMSISLINSATGEILAAPSYSTLKVNSALIQERRNPNTERRFIGSCFKPLMTLASVQLYDTLLSMQTTAPMWQNRVAIGNRQNDITILGHRVLNISDYIANQWRERISMTQYLSSSNDAYPILLAMYAFTQPNTSGELPANFSTLNVNHFPATLLKDSTYYESGILITNTLINDKSIFDIHNLNFAKMLDALYSINSNEAKLNSQDIKNIPEIYVWRLYNQNSFSESDSISFPDISPEITNMNYWSWYTSGETFRTKVISWLLGQGDNSWSPLKLTEAWARMVTKYPVQLSFIRNPTPEYNMLLPQKIDEKREQYRHTHRLSTDNVWNRFLDIFRDAQESGTLLPPVRDRVRNVNDSLVVLGKTGTPDEFPLADALNNKEIKYDLGLYTFSLMTDNQYNRIIANRENLVAHNSGITAMIRIVHTYNPEYGSCFGTERANKIQSLHARDFISNRNQVLEKILFYTDELFR